MTAKKYCNSSAQLESLASFTKMLSNFNENQIYEATGCLASCVRYEFDRLSVRKSDKRISPGNLINDLHIAFIIFDASHEEKEQYLLYDVDSFIADIGGYLGLLLGWSVFSVYNEVADMMVRFTKIWRSHSKT